MKNLRKLSRTEQSQISGGALAKRCRTDNDCLGLWCCEDRCSNIRCAIN